MRSLAIVFVLAGSMFACRARRQNRIRRSLQTERAASRIREWRSSVSGHSPRRTAPSAATGRPGIHRESRLRLSAACLESHTSKCPNLGRMVTLNRLAPSPRGRRYFFRPAWGRSAVFALRFAMPVYCSLISGRPRRLSRWRHQRPKDRWARFSGLRIF
jgi:hypothetical protein